jgi:small GTP-binding protein
MANYIEHIKVLEKEIGEKLKEISLDKLDEMMQIGFSLNEKNEIVGLNLDGIKMNSLPGSISELTNLERLSLYRTSINDISLLHYLPNLKHLNLNRTGIREIPVLAELKNLTSLDVGGNTLDDISILREVPNLMDLCLSHTEIQDFSIIGELTSLKTLDLSRTKIQDISILAELKNLISLDLSDNEIGDISILGELKNLMNLGLSNTGILDISILGDLQNLVSLDLGYNILLSDISFIRNFPHLTRLVLNDNEICDISVLGELKHLIYLDLRENKIKELPGDIADWGMEIDSDSTTGGTKGIFLHGNPLEIPPLEIVKKGVEAVKSYFRDLKKGEIQPLNEVKVLLVGDGGSGKTSLVKRMLSKGFDQDEAKTDGIDISNWTVNKNTKKVSARIWDFGGQEIMHATHQFFLTKRSLYILVLDGRKDEKTEHWLKLIESFGGNSPVLLVLNKIDENPGFEVNRKFLQEKYRNIKGFYRVSCKTTEGIETFVKTLEDELAKVEMIRTTWAYSWFNVKTQLEHMKNHYISYPEYIELCAEEEINDQSSQGTLVDFLNDLGVVLHFEDFDLGDTYVLEPKWVTEAVYKIINSEILAKYNGVLRLKLMDKILKQKKKEDYYYPPDKYRYIIELMKKFELCYKLDSEKVLVPDLLEVEERSFNFDYDKALKFIILYDFLPKSIMPRFIVRMHKDIKRELMWRTGVVLSDNAFHSTAVIKVDEEDKKIYIYVIGKQVRDYFSVLRKTLRDINGSFEKLKTTELIPLPDHNEITVEYEELIGYEQMGIDEIIIGKLKRSYSVSKLLNGLEEPGKRRNDVSYSYKYESKSNSPVAVVSDDADKVEKKRGKDFWKIASYIGLILTIIASIIAIIQFVF